MKLTEKNIILITIFTLATILLGSLSISAKNTRRNTQINEIVVDIKNKDYKFVNQQIIEKIFEGEIDSVNHVKIKHLSLVAVEDLLSKNPFVKKCDAYLNQKNQLCFNITQKEPLFRVINNTVDNYYIDEFGEKFPNSKNYTANVPIVSGAFNYELDSLGNQTNETINHLLDFFRYIETNETAKALITKVEVARNGDISFIPRTGGHYVIVGKPNKLDEKFNRLFVFYKEGLSKVGWNKYSSINLKYDNQIIAKKN